MVFKRRVRFCGRRREGFVAFVAGVVVVGVVVVTDIGAAARVDGEWRGRVWSFLNFLVCLAFPSQKPFTGKATTRKGFQGFQNNTL